MLLNDHNGLATILGYVFFRFPGAVLGFILGSLLDTTTGKEAGGFGGVFTRKEQVTPKDFELNLLSLSSIVIKADGHVNQTELNYVRQYFVSAYGERTCQCHLQDF